MNLFVGWNQVPYNGATRVVDQALGNCLQSVSAVFLLNPATQSYSWWFKGASVGVNTLTSLSPGQILWVLATASCAWQQT